MPTKIIMPENISPNQIIYTNHNPIVMAFTLNGFLEDEIASQLKNYGKDDLEGFLEYLKTRLPERLSSDWFIEKTFNKIRIDYQYFKEKDEK